MKNFTKYLAVFFSAILFGMIVVTLFPPQSEAIGVEQCNPANPICRGMGRLLQPFWLPPLALEDCLCR